MADEYIRLDTTIIAIDHLINEVPTYTMAKALFRVKDTIYSQQKYFTDVQPVRCAEWQQNVNDKLEQIMTHYTFAQQRQVFAEECAEAIQAAMKLSRAETVADYEKAAAALDSEVADVLIMAQQMRLYLGKDKVDAEIQRKLDRQIERIKAEQEG